MAAPKKRAVAGKRVRKPAPKPVPAQATDTPPGNLDSWPVDALSRIIQEAREWLQDHDSYAVAGLKLSTDEAAEIIYALAAAELWAEYEDGTLTITKALPAGVPGSGGIVLDPEPALLLIGYALRQKGVTSSTPTTLTDEAGATWSIHGNQDGDMVLVKETGGIRGAEDSLRLRGLISEISLVERRISVLNRQKGECDRDPEMKLPDDWQMMMDREQATLEPLLDKRAQILARQPVVEEYPFPYRLQGARVTITL